MSTNPSGDCPASATTGCEESGCPLSVPGCAAPDGAEPQEFRANSSIPAIPVIKIFFILSSLDKNKSYNHPILDGFFYGPKQEPVKYAALVSHLTRL
jgi:hypothetical protein